jgi:hypothetical protein
MNQYKIEESGSVPTIYRVYQRFLFVFWTDQGTFWCDSEDEASLVLAAKKFITIKSVRFEA